MNHQQMFTKTFYNAPIGMAVLGLDLQTFMVNSAFCKLLGYSENEFLRLSAHDVTHPQDLHTSFVCDMLNRNIDTYQTNKRYFNKLGNIVTVSAHYSVIYDDGGDPLFFIIQVIEIPEHDEKNLAH